MTGPYIDCPSCGAHKIPPSCTRCDVCETTVRYEAKLATQLAARTAAEAEAKRVHALLSGWIAAACARHAFGVASHPVPETLRRRIDSLLEQNSQIPGLLRELQATSKRAAEAEAKLAPSTTTTKPTPEAACGKCGTELPGPGACWNCASTHDPDDVDELYVRLADAAAREALLIARLSVAETVSRAAGTLALLGHNCPPKDAAEQWETAARTLREELAARRKELQRRDEQERLLREQLAALSAAAATHLARADAALAAEREAHVETMQRLARRTAGEVLNARLSLASDIVTLERTIAATAPYEIGLRMKLTGQLVSARAKAAEMDAMRTVTECVVLYIPHREAEG